MVVMGFATGRPDGWVDSVMVEETAGGSWHGCRSADDNFFTFCPNEEGGIQNDVVLILYIYIYIYFKILIEPFSSDGTGQFVQFAG